MAPLPTGPEQLLLCSGEGVTNVVVKTIFKIQQQIQIQIQLNTDTGPEFCQPLSGSRGRQT